MACLFLRVDKRPSVQRSLLLMSHASKREILADGGRRNAEGVGEFRDARVLFAQPGDHRSHYIVAERDAPNAVLL